MCRFSEIGNVSLDFDGIGLLETHGRGANHRKNLGLERRSALYMLVLLLLISLI